MKRNAQSKKLVFCHPYGKYSYKGLIYYNLYVIIFDSNIDCMHVIPVCYT